MKKVHIKDTTHNFIILTTYNFISSKFKDVLFNKNVFRHPMKKIGPRKHKIYTQESNKVSLSCFYDKKDEINTLAYGHRDIPRNE